MRNINLFLMLVYFFGCKDNEPQDGILNESDKYAICNDLLANSNCLGGNGDYCLFGYKWGDGNSFTPTGYNSIGPKKSGGVVTFSFKESNGLVNTHSQINLPSKSFDELVSCAKSKIRRALNAWSENANISFKEQDEDSNIIFSVADIRQSGVGYPNFPKSPCNLISGNVIIQSSVKYNDCDSFYSFVLHEIGHSLGLGHVNSNNIMNADLVVNFNELQPGDIQGIVEIYGEK